MFLWNKPVWILHRQPSLWAPAYSAPTALQCSRTVYVWFHLTPSLLWEAHGLSATHLILHHPPFLSKAVICITVQRAAVKILPPLEAPLRSSNPNNRAQETVALHHKQHLSYAEDGELAGCVSVSVCVCVCACVCRNSARALLPLPLPLLKPCYQHWGLGR